MDENIASFAEFARLLGVKAAAVTSLRHAGRLVLTEDGKRVLIAESRHRMRETADPSKAGVVARHAAARAEAAGGGVDDAALSDGADDDGEGDSAQVGAYQSSRARREHYLALAAQRDDELEIGKLMIATEVIAAVGSAVATLRGTFERLPDVLGPQLAAATDEGLVRSMLAEAIEHALDEAARQLGALTKGPGT